ncbi:MAG: hypothetical protein QXL94_06150 [Candidatus Parvarchaeum sp.]
MTDYSAYEEVAKSFKYESEFKSWLISVAKHHGFRVYSIPDSRRASDSGFPDLVLAKMDLNDSHVSHMAAFEIKVSRYYKATEDQLWWLNAFRNAGIPSGIITPETVCNFIGYINTK